MKRRMIPHGFTTLCVSLPTCLVLLAALVRADEAQPVRLLEQHLDPSFKQCFVLIEGGQISCYRRTGDGPTLLLMPGTFSDARVYVDTIRSLNPEFDLLILEYRGLGGSWPPPDASSIEDCATDAIMVLDALGVDQCYVGGHSLGGMISLELGQRIPERLRGVIPIEGWAYSDVSADAFQRDTKSTLSPQQLELIQDYRDVLLKRWTEEQRKMFSSIWKQWNGSEFLRTTELPVLELWGDRGRERPDRVALGLPDRENIELVWFAGASHSLLIERPREVAEAINDFVARIEQQQ